MPQQPMCTGHKEAAENPVAKPPGDAENLGQAPLSLPEIPLIITSTQATPVSFQAVAAKSSISDFSE